VQHTIALCLCAFLANHHTSLWLLLLLLLLLPIPEGGLGSTPLYWAIASGDTQRVTVLLAAGANVRAIMNDGDTCLSLAVTSVNGTAGVEQLLQMWDAPAEVIQGAVLKAAECRKWDAAVLLIRQLGRQNKDAAVELLTGPVAAFSFLSLEDAAALQGSLLAVWLDSETEQQRVQLKKQARELSSQRLELQQLLVGVAGMHRQAVAAQTAAPARQPGAGRSLRRVGARVSSWVTDLFACGRKPV
jgi:hypothetical protein